MLSKSKMLYGFADEMEKIAYAAKKPKAKKDEEIKPNLNFYERHPKKILGAGAASIIGGALLAKKFKKKPGPGIHIPKSMGEMFSDQERADLPRKILKYFKRSGTKKLDSPSGVKPTQRVEVGRRLSPEGVNTAIDKAFRGGRVNTRLIEKPRPGYQTPDKTEKPKLHKK